MFSLKANDKSENDNQDESWQHGCGTGSTWVNNSRKQEEKLDISFWRQEAKFGILAY